ncbi:MAG: hypothetical protein ACRCUI_06475 [Polymorphobacter sp.]
MARRTPGNRRADISAATRRGAGVIVFARLWRTSFEPVGPAPIDIDALGATHADVRPGGLGAGGTGS